jgi:phthalate 4,5-dioxygenase oxygenase subunit
VLNQADNEVLVRIEQDAPMAKLMRRFWTPVLLSGDLESEGAPRRFKALGGNYVAFRDTRGDVGVLDENCPHRGASLALARNEDCVLQCLYHGWKIDRTGRIVETPTEPADSTFKDRIRHAAYPVVEAGGIVWAFFGGGVDGVDTEPPFPAFDWTKLDPEFVHIVRLAIRCNWAQVMEGTVDSAHAGFLHNDMIRRVSEGTEFKPGGGGLLGTVLVDDAPKIEIENQPYGFRYAALRSQGGETSSTFVRVTDFVMPFWALFPAPDEWRYTQAAVPCDDSNTIFYWVQARFDGVPLTDEDRARFDQWSGVGELDDSFNMNYSVENLWGQDREAMKRTRGDSFSFSGMSGVQVEDLGVQESMGPVYDRSKEHLGTSDVAVIRMRRLMIEAARALQRGDPEVVGLNDQFGYDRIWGWEKALDPTEAWRTVTAGSDLSDAPA